MRVVGRTTVEPGEAVAGTFQNVTFRFEIESGKMAPGSGIRLELPVAYGETEAYFWSKPQTQYPEAPGFVSASSSATELIVSSGGIAGGIAMLEVVGDTLRTGDEIVLKYRGIVQSLARDVEIRLQTRSFRGGQWVSAGSPERIRILPREAHTAIVTTPSDVEKGVPFEASVVLIDRFGNLATGFRGDVHFTSTDAAASIPAAYTFAEADSGRRVFPGIRFETEGFQRLTIHDPEQNLQISTHYAWVWPGRPPYRRLFGDTHFHTGTGAGHHGFIGEASSGDINTLATEDFQSLNSAGDHRGNFTDAISAYEYARDVVRLDFASASEHDAILFDEATWEESQRIADSFNNRGRFTTLFAYEWTAGFTHHIVLYRDRGGSVFARSEYPDLRSLWAALDEQGVPALTIPHVTWTVDEHPMWEDVNDTYRRIGEIYSLWNNRFLVQPDDQPQRFELGIEDRWSYQFAWHRGHRIGLVGATDNHLGRPGANNYTIYTHHTGGFAGVLAPENTREELWNALTARRTYATTGTRIYLDFEADGHPMGWSYAANGPPTLSVRVAGTNRLASVEVVRYQDGGYGSIHTEEPVGDWTRFSVVDEAFNGDAFYYVRVTQVEEYPGRPWSHSTAEMAWSSPIWVGR